MEGITPKDMSLFAVYAQASEDFWNKIEKNQEKFLSRFSPRGGEVAAAMLAVKFGREVKDRETALIAIDIFEWALHRGLSHFSHNCSRHTNSQHDKMWLDLKKDKKMIEEAKKKYSA